MVQPWVSTALRWYCHWGSYNPGRYCSVVVPAVYLEIVEPPLYEVGQLLRFLLPPLIHPVHRLQIQKVRGQCSTTQTKRVWKSLVSITWTTAIHLCTFIWVTTALFCSAMLCTFGSHGSFQSCGRCGWWAGSCSQPCSSDSAAGAGCSTRTQWPCSPPAASTLHAPWTAHLQNTSPYTGELRYLELVGTE